MRSSIERIDGNWLKVFYSLKACFLLLSVIINFSLNFIGEIDFLPHLVKSSRTKPLNIEGVISELSSDNGNNL